MNIEIPSFIRDEHRESAIVFLALAYKLSEHEGFKKTRYFIDSRDVRATMQFNLTEPQTIFGKYAYWFRMTRCSDTHMFFEWQRDNIETEIYTIKAPELKQVWTYLLGRLQCGEVVEEWNSDGFPTRQPAYLSKEDGAIFQCTGKPQPEHAAERLRRKKRREAEALLKPKNPVGRPRKKDNQ